MDPLSGFEGRRVLVPESEGSDVDGEMVLTYNLTVEAETAVSQQNWASVKARIDMATGP